MNGELDELAKAAAAVLVAALASDAGEAAERWFAGVIGQQRRLSATRAELAAAVGWDRDRVVQAAVSTWTYRLRDILEENPAAVQALRDLVAAQPPAEPAPPAPASAAPQVPVAPAPPGYYGQPQAPVADRVPPSSHRRRPTGALTAIGVVVVLAVLALGGWLAHWPPALFPAANPKLPAGTDTVSITSTTPPIKYNSQGHPTGALDAQGDLPLQKEQGTIDGLALTGTGGFDLKQFPWPTENSTECNGVTGVESTGTLGGTPYHVLLTCTPGAKQDPDFEQTYTGDWGSSPIHMTATLNDENAANGDVVQLSGTIGSQRVTANIVLKNGAYSANKPYVTTQSGTITVS